MSTEHTRRGFLKLSEITLAALAASGAETKLPAGRTQAVTSSSDIQVWTTAGEQQLASSSPIRWKSGSAAATADIVLHPENQFQPILGFGGAFTDAACYTLNQLPPTDREKLLYEMFHPSQLGLSVCRTCIGASDYSTKLYSYDDGDPDPDLKRFSIDHDREYILPVLRQSRKVN